MKKIIKHLSIILLVLSFIFVPINKSEAGSKHLIIINTKTNRLAYYVNNKEVKTFKIASGKASTPTPTGKTKIVNKIKNRPYYSGGIPGGSPNNPLGDRWLGLHLRGTYGTTYGIHGNNNSSSIGKNVSAGCIRMYNDDIRWLFNQVSVGTDVIIKSTSQSFKQIAASYGITIYDGSTPIKTGWRTENGNKYYYNSNGRKVTGWQTIGKAKYYFNSNGIMLSGWQTIGKVKYYFNSHGVMLSGWQTLGGKKYFFNSNGAMQTGPQKIGGKMYFFNPRGFLTSGWQSYEGYRYYAEKDGKLALGLKTIDNKTYYFYKDGKMAKKTTTPSGIIVDENGIVVSIKEEA